MWLFLILVAVPVVEIALFIEVGSAIGTWATMGIVIATALAGSVLLRWQGLQALRNFQGRLMAGEDPGGLIADGMMILAAGLLLLTPGFFTDTVGFLLLVPGVRGLVWRFLAARLKTVVVTGGGPGYRASRTPHGTVDGEYEEVPPRDIPPGGPPR